MDYFGHKKPDGWKEMVKKEFKKADTSGDGEVDKKEIGVYLFKLVDSNGDGAWDLREVNRAIRGIADFSKNELIDDWKAKIKAVFDHVDKDGDGKCSPKELFTAMEKHGIPDINDLFKK
jgi:Ca2+-binding EF-hand superfamily protein